MVDINVIEKCIKAFKNSDENMDEYNRKYRYDMIIMKLEKLKKGVLEGSYPKNLELLDMVHYFNDVFDSKELYSELLAVDEWYDDNYREKTPFRIGWERNLAYLIDELKINAKLADKYLTKLVMFKKSKLYAEFSQYVETRQFPDDGICIEGYTAKKLFETGKLSPLGAYNYLIYLSECPQEALSDLKKGLPRK